MFPIEPPSSMHARRPPSRRLTVVAALAWTVAAGAAAQTAQLPLPLVQLGAGIHLITAEIADNDQSRMSGLMFRKELPPNHGMVFVFEQKATHCMWMRNTLLPLSVAFIDDDGGIVNIEDMRPQTENSHCARRPVRYALEMAQGWFSQHGIRPGQTLRGFPSH